MEAPQNQNWPDPSNENPNPSGEPQPNPGGFLRVISSIVIVLGTLGLDWVSKYVILHFTMNPPRVIEVTPFFNLVLVWNQGVSFGMFGSGDYTLFLSVFAILVTLGMGVWLFKTTSNLLTVAISLIIGGAVGNIIDRLTYGAVIDFLDFHWAGYHWPAFNVADIAVCLGAALIVIESIFTPNPPEKESEPQ